MLIHIEEISPERAEEFWETHIRYLIDDGIIEDEEDREYFQSEEYRGTLIKYMKREPDRHRMVYFLQGGVRIGAAQYTTYLSEGGKCYLMDFWVFPEFRGNGIGHACFEALDEKIRAEGAASYEINCNKENAHRFWESLGFRDQGVDEYDVPVMVK